MMPAAKNIYRAITVMSLATLTGAATIPVATLPAATVAQAAVRDGSYTTTAQFFKTGTTTASESNQFFDQAATIKVSNGQPQLILKMKSGANYLKQFQLKGADQTAKIDRGANNTATITLDLPDTNGKYTVAMDLEIVPGMKMHETADLQLDVSQLPQAAASTSASSASSSSASSQATSSSSSSAATNGKTSASGSSTKTSQANSTTSTGTSSATSGATTSTTDTLTLPLAIRKTADASQTSEASAFFAPQVMVKPEGDQVAITFTLTSGSQFIRQMTLNGQAPTVTTAGKTTQYTFHLSKAAYQLGGGQFAFALTIPGGTQMNETAYAVWNQGQFSPTALASFLQQTGADDSATGTTTSASGLVTTTATSGQTSAGIDPTKEIQDISYAVYKEDQSGLSDANAYYTHTAHVVKTGTSGYAVTLTVQAPSGVVNFRPLSIAAGAITGQTHQTSGGNDVWTYTFHISSADALNQPVAGQIAVGVPMLNMPTQNYRVWFKFGQSQLGGGPSITSLASDGGTVLPASDANGGDITPSAGTTSAAAGNSASAAGQPFDLKAAQKLLGRYRVSNQPLHRVQTSLVDYPIIQALAGFLALDLVLIGGTLFWRHRLIKQAKDKYHEESH